MTHARTWIRPVIALTGITLSLALMANPASAARVSEAIPPTPYEQLRSCGDVEFLVLGTIEGMSTTVARGPNGILLHKEMYKATETRTNLDTGITVWVDQQFREGDQRAYLNDDGTRLTVIVSLSGVAVFRDAPDGNVVGREAGHLSFELVFDTNGTPTNHDDDTYVDGSFRLLHDDLNFCPVLLDATGS